MATNTNMIAQWLVQESPLSILYRSLVHISFNLEASALKVLID
ncbi:hypothetical protein [aff. Roholtiella sp. LEGE 12411]